MQRLVPHAPHAPAGTVFAYGQTSSGKTFTMSGAWAAAGPRSHLAALMRLNVAGDEHSGGLLQLAARDIFKCIEQNPDREYLLRVSYIEIYNEVICDLLEEKRPQLRVRESRERVRGLLCCAPLVAL